MTRRYRRFALLGVILVSGCLDSKGCKDLENFPCLLCPNGPSPPMPDPYFIGYDQVRPDSSFGWLINQGRAPLAGLRVAVNFGCDTVIWVRVSRTALAPRDSSRVASPSEMVRGTPSGPPIARISWSGGSYEHLSLPDIRIGGWLSRDDTSAVGLIVNFGGDTADSSRVRAETRYGIQVVPTSNGSIGPRLSTEFRAATRDSAGVSVYPRVLEVLWVNHRCTVIR